MNAPFARSKLESFKKHFDEYSRRIAKDMQSQRGWYDDEGVRQGGLMAFVRYFWPVLEPETPFVDGWPLWAMCEHLEAVTFNEITRLVMNVPPGFMKSMLVDVFWPAWEWGPQNLAHYRYLTFSYSASLTERDNDRFRTIVASEPYQRLYGPIKMKVEYGTADLTEGVGLRNKTTIKVMNTRTGWKLASSVGGVATGERGMRVCLDDPHSVTEAESDRVRSETIRWFREAISSRFNNLDTGALVIIMQRVHEDDVSGVALGPEFDYCHLMIPWEFDPARIIDDDGKPVPTQIGWLDPRLDPDNPYANEGEAAWPDRFSEESIARLKKELGPYGWASQYQQSPVPRGGGLFRQEWWNIWDDPKAQFPIFDYVIASLDGAYTEDEENDPSALTVWGVWSKPSFDGGAIDEKTGHLWQGIGASQQKIMLVHAWRKHLQFSGARIERLPVEAVIDGQRWLPDAIVAGMSDDEIKRRNARYKRRTSSKWGLIEHVEDTCLLFKVDLLLIEAKASGQSAAQEIQNRYGNQRFGIQLMPVKGDKVARAMSVVPTFTQGLVYAPIRDWSDMVINEALSFPRGRYDDLTDSMVQALRYLRDAGMAKTNDESAAEERARVTHQPRQKALYPV